MASLDQLGKRPCGACRALVSSCRHWRLVPLPPPSQTAVTLASLWESRDPRAVLAEACRAPDGIVETASPAPASHARRREAARRMARRGMLTQVAPRSTRYRVTDEGRRVHAKLLEMDAGRF